MKTSEEVAAVASVLANRQVDVSKMMKQMRKDALSEEQVLQQLVAALFTGLAYGNWPK